MAGDHENLDHSDILDHKCIHHSFSEVSSSLSSGLKWRPTFVMMISGISAFRIWLSQPGYARSPANESSPTVKHGGSLYTLPASVIA